MICDLGFSVKADGGEDYKVFGELIKFATENKLERPPYWGEAEDEVLKYAIIVACTLAGTEDIEAMIDRMGPEVYQEGVDMLHEAIPLMVHAIDRHCPPYVKFDYFDGKYCCSPDVDAVRTAVSAGKISNTPGDNPAVYTIEGVTYYVNDKNEVEWML